ncbi:hypothetical protein [Vibrio cholerae]|uniref:hypothetical protein n=1 Tax=Vibrio cholerae TaxID=666 RepID=UPI0020B6D326|nr:hypothetical protein [Vibrio cholerae]
MESLGQRKARLSEKLKQRQEIISAQSTLDELPKGVSYVKGKDGKGYILSRKMGTPFKTEAGEMAVEVR